MGVRYGNGIGIAKDEQKAVEWFQKAADQGYAVAQFNMGMGYANGRGVDKDERKAVEWFQKAADQGYAAAQNNLGWMYGNGIGVDKDEQKAVEYYQKAADQGDATAQVNLGGMYANGRGVDKDERKAVEWYQKAADQGDATAQYNLGWRYANGRGVAKDDYKAVEWYQKAADQGYAAAQYNLGIRYENGRGIEQDERKAVTWYQKAADQGHVAAQYNLGRMYANERGVAKDEQKAVEWYQKAAHQGHAAAQYALGWMYANGKGIAKDDYKAVEWYQKAADQGHANAQNTLGWMYANGKGISHNYRKAVEWYQKAAAQGDVAAQSNLGRMYEHGRGVAKDDYKAVEWYQKAADQGYAMAQYNLGRMYKKVKNYQEALKWYQKAADQGDATAQVELGFMYEYGQDQGVSQNYQEALKWYQKAAAQGDAAAQSNLGRMYEDGRGVSQNYQEALKWYIKSANQGYWEAAGKPGHLALKGNRFAQEWIIQEAGKGNKTAQYTLCEMYIRGVGVEQDVDKGAECYIKAAKQGSEDNVDIFDELLSKIALVGGEFVQQWAIAEAEKGHKTAQYILGRMYEQGEGVEKDEDKAAGWYIKAANQRQWKATKILSKLALKGNKFAQQWATAGKEEGEVQYTLGRLYEQGIGVNKDENKAVECYFRAFNQGSSHDALMSFLALKRNKLVQEWIIGKAKEGNSWTQYILGQMYEQGEGVEKDIEKAVEYYIQAVNRGYVSRDRSASDALGELALQGNRLAQRQIVEKAEKGDAWAQYSLGQMYEQGVGVEKDIERAVECYIQAVDRGHWSSKRTASDALGELALQGNRLAQTWIVEKAEKGVAWTQYTLGQMYEQGVGVEKDIEKAVECYIKSANQEPSNAQEGSNSFKALKGLIWKGNKLAQRWIIEEADKGNKTAQYTLGQMYEQGKGIEKNEDKAAEYYIQATNQQHRDGPEAISVLALKGNKFAQEWIIKKAGEEDIKAQYILSRMYEKGIGVEKDEERALKWHIKWANLGDNASFNIVKEFVWKGNELAQEWMTKKADKGDKRAQYTLKCMNYEGEGTSQDYQEAVSSERIIPDYHEAVKWYEKAAERGYITAQNKPETMYSNCKGTGKIGSSDNSISNAISSGVSSHQIPWYTPAKWMELFRSYCQTSGLAINTLEAEELLRLQSKCERLIKEADSKTADKWYRYSLEDLQEDITIILKQPEEITDHTIKHFSARLEGIEKDFLREPLLEKPSFFAGKKNRIKVNGFGNNNEGTALRLTIMPLLGAECVPLAIGN